MLYQVVPYQVIVCCGSKSCHGIPYCVIVCCIMLFYSRCYRIIQAQSSRITHAQISRGNTGLSPCDACRIGQYQQGCPMPRAPAHSIPRPAATTRVIEGSWAESRLSKVTASQLCVIVLDVLLDHTYEMRHIKVIVRPISLLTLSLLTLLHSNLPGNPLWAWEFHHFKLTLCSSRTL